MCTVDEQAAWCRVTLHTEPIHKFLSFITYHVKSQDLVPDFLDIRNQRFMDVKTMSFGSMYINVRFRHALHCDTVRFRGLEIHKSSLHKSVTGKARDIDIQ